MLLLHNKKLVPAILKFSYTVFIYSTVMYSSFTKPIQTPKHSILDQYIGKGFVSPFTCYRGIALLMERGLIGTTENVPWN